MNEREYWRPHVRSKKFPAIRYAAASMPISPGSFIRITCRGEKPATSPDLVSNTSELENEAPSSKFKGALIGAPSTLRKNRMPEQVRSSDSHWLPSVRSVPASSHRLKDMPGIFVSPAPKYARKAGRGNWNSAISSKTYYHRSTHHTRNATRHPDGKPDAFPSEISTQSQPVTIPALGSEGLNETASEERNSAASRNGGDTREILKEEKLPLREAANHTKFCPNLVNLNQNFIDISSRFGGKVALNVALSRKFVAGTRALEHDTTIHFNPRSRNQHSLSASPRYLPLREVYLKGTLTESKEVASNYHEEKTTRIWSWLNKLNYLDESKLPSNKSTERAQ